MSARRTGPWEKRAQADAEARGLTREEYGVYKGDYGAVVKPVNSAGGLLAIAIILTIIAVFLLSLLVLSIVAPGDNPNNAFGPTFVFTAVIGVGLAAVAWGYFLKEYKAARLRKARGKSLDGPNPPEPPPSRNRYPSSPE